MPGDDFRQDDPVVREILAGAAGLPPDERAAYLDAAFSEHPAWRDEILSLLEALERAGPQLAEPTVTHRAMEAPPASHLGTRVGRYKLLQQIGEGGFGVVFMAEQEHPVRRVVALKILKLGMDTKQVIARFEAERQALAMMDHPSIAKILDGGSTESGRPYFVMELVRGSPITEYCDKHHLPPRERLALFIQVCQAVQHAHQKGVIHRDLKPTNVLVTIGDDGRPVPKVIDFGIAKATVGQRLTDRTLFTEFRQLLGTPQYMSPEQAESDGMVDVDTRSDVYALGVLLYELLTGTTPLEKSRLVSAAYAEVRRILVEEDPPRPSTRLSTMGDALTEVALRRQTDPKRLGQLVRGELDWIVMRALEKDRSRRYETANGLARDVERYLADQPVEACPPTRAYRLRKFARRNKAALATGALIGAVLLVASFVSTWQAVRATRAEVVAARERDQALQEKARADEQARVAGAVISFFGFEVLGQASPQRAARLGLQHSEDLTVRAALDRAVGLASKRFKDDPALGGAVLGHIASVYMELQDYPKARALAERALDLRRRARGDEDSTTLGWMNNLGSVYNESGDHLKAEAVFLNAIPIARRVLGDNHDCTRLMEQNLALTYCMMGRYAEAEAPLARSFRKGATKPHVYQVQIMAMIYLNKKEYDKAQPLLLETIASEVKRVGEESYFVHSMKVFLAMTYVGQRRFEEAEALYRAALAYYQNFLGEESRDARETMLLLAELYDAWGKPEQAAAWRAKLPTTAPTTSPAATAPAPAPAPLR